MKKLSVCLFSIFLCANVMAKHTAKTKRAKAAPPKVTSKITWSKSGWYAVVSGGFGVFSKMMKSDGYTPMARMALGRDVLSFKDATVGLEAGLQNGNRARIKTTGAVLAALGGPAVQSTLKPVIDLLVTVHSKMLHHGNGLGVFAKVGGALRMMQFDRTSLHNARKINPELQFGLEKDVSNQLAVNVFYQGIYGGTSRLAVTGALGAGRGNITNIPSQQAIFIGLKLRA